jgi:hypothetical protein
VGAERPLVSGGGPPASRYGRRIVSR